MSVNFFGFLETPSCYFDQEHSYVLQKSEVKNIEKEAQKAVVIFVLRKYYYKIKGGDSKTYARTRAERRRYKPTGVIKKNGMEERQMRRVLPYDICIDDDVTDSLRMKWLVWRQQQDNFGQKVFQILIDMLWGLDSLKTLARISPILEISAWEDESIVLIQYVPAGLSFLIKLKNK